MFVVTSLLGSFTIGEHKVVTTLHYHITCRMHHLIHLKGGDVVVV